jgi:hypothetical protein
MNFQSILEQKAILLVKMLIQQLFLPHIFFIRISAIQTFSVMILRGPRHYIIAIKPYLYEGG